MKRVLATAISLIPAIGSACCISYGLTAMQLARESAVIVWDDKTGVEHFIRKADFEGKAKDFGFIFPSPTEPFRIEVADEELFGFLESLKPRPRSIGCSADMLPAGKGGVDILQQKLVGDYLVTVLRSTSGAEISQWLAKNKYTMRPAMTPWFDHYIKQGWVFTALKYQGKLGKTPTRAVAISFKAKQPHYPYKMPTDTFAAGHYRPLDLYVLSRNQMRGQYTSGESWETNEQWSTTVNDTKTNSAKYYANNGSAQKTLDLPKGLVLSRFKNVPEASNYDHDLVFVPATDNTNIYAGSVGIGLIGFLLWKSKKSRS